MKEGFMAKTFVDRPKGVDLVVIERLRKTVDNGKAVPLPLHGEETHIVRERYRMHLKKYGLRMCSKKRGMAIEAWAEKATKE
jgi:hypothetical protein